MGAWRVVIAGLTRNPEAGVATPGLRIESAMTKEYLAHPLRRDIQEPMKVR
jgi:hypothetical protein